MNSILVAPLCAAVLIFTAPSPSGTDSVFVEHRGSVDLAAFKCVDVNRSSFIHRVCYDAAQQYMVILLKGTVLQLLRD